VPSTLPFMPADNERLDVAALETWLWDAACAIRGATDAPKFRDSIQPLALLVATGSGTVQPKAG
jgi:hypothetical protein